MHGRSTQKVKGANDLYFIDSCYEGLEFGFFSVTHKEIRVYSRGQNKRPPQAPAGPLKPLKCSQKAEFFFVQVGTE